MKKVYVWGVFLVLAAVFPLVAIGQAQQPAAQPGQPSPFDPPAAQPGQAAQQRLQQAQQAQQPGGIETRQNIMAPANRFGQQRGANLQGGIPDPEPTPAELPSPSSTSQPTPWDNIRDTQQGKAGTTAGSQPGELGVWLGTSGGPGVQIRQVTAGSAADQAGLAPGDVILQINGRGATTPTGVSQMIRQIPAGQTAMLEIWRDGNQQELSVTLQPFRQAYEVGFRGGDSTSTTTSTTTSRTDADLALRTTRLEEQYNMVMQELQRLRQDMAKLRASAGSQTTSGGIGQTSTEPEFDALERLRATQPASTEPAAAISQPAALPPQPAATPDPFGASATEPATEPAAEEPAAEPASEPAADPATDDADPFGATATEPATEPAAEEPAAEPASEPAADPADEDADPFGASTTEPAAEEATPPATEAAPAEKEAETESEADPFFE